MENQKSQKPKYKIIISILGQDHIGEGSTFKKACQNLNLHWKDVKGAGIITVSKGDKQEAKRWNRPMIVRIVSNPLTQQIWGRYFELLLK